MMISSNPREFVRACIWMGLAICLLLDVGMAEMAITGGQGDVGYVDDLGHFAMPEPEPRLWFPIVAIVILQGLLVFIQIRLRAPRPAQPQIFPNVHNL